jgi:hypothetical protein
MKPSRRANRRQRAIPQSARVHMRAAEDPTRDMQR